MDGYGEEAYKPPDPGTFETSDSTNAVFYAKDTRSTQSSLHLIEGGFSPSFSHWRKWINTRKSWIIIVFCVVISIAAIFLAVFLPIRRCALAQSKERPVGAMAVKVNSTAANSSFTPEASKPFTTAATAEMATWPDEITTLISDGWFPVRNLGKIYLYKISSNQTKYRGAVAECANMGATLAAKGMRIAAVRKNLFSAMVFPFTNIYIGLDDLSSKHTWKWIDGVYSTHDNTEWGPNEPNNGRERCGEVTRARRFLINDTFCSRLLHSLCEKVI